MIFFKTRHEVKQARQEVAELREMIRSHFDIKFTMEDFKQFTEDNTNSKKIPTSPVGEFLHFYKMLSPTIRSKYQLYYRGKPLRPESKEKKL